MFASHDYMLALQGEIEDAGGGGGDCRRPSRARAPWAGGGFSIADRRRAEGEPDRPPAGHRAGSVGRKPWPRRIDGYPAEAHSAGRIYGKGVCFRLADKAPFERLICPPPIHGRAGHPLSQGPGRPGGVRARPALSSTTTDYSVDPAKAAEFDAYIRKFWPGLPEGALAPDYAGMRPESCTVRTSPSRTSGFTRRRATTGWRG